MPMTHATRTELTWHLNQWTTALAYFQCSRCPLQLDHICKQDCLSVEGRPPKSVFIYPSMTLTPWPWYPTLT